jgi:bifunctional non-homologous end joining protein LigD
MARSGRDQTFEIEGRRLKLSNLDKPMYAVAGFTKGQVIDYYIRVAPYPLPISKTAQSR